MIAPLQGDSLSDLAQALNVVVKHFGWQGNIGIGLPGRIAKDIVWSSHDKESGGRSMGSMDEAEAEDSVPVGGSYKVGAEVQARPQLESTNPLVTQSKFDCEKDINSAFNLNLVSELAPLTALSTWTWFLSSRL